MKNGQMNRKEKGKEKLQEVQHDIHFHRHRNPGKIQNWKLKPQSISKDLSVCFSAIIISAFCRR